MEGTYKGIGATIQETDDGIKIVGIFKKSPAEKAGLKENDYILKVNGKTTKGKSADETVKMIKKKDKAVIVVKRGEEEKSFNITLEVIDIPSVESKTIEKNGKKVGIISLSVFAKNTGLQFKNELKTLEDNKLKSLAYLPITLDNNNRTKDFWNKIFLEMIELYDNALRKSKNLKYYDYGEILNIINDINLLDKLIYKISVLFDTIKYLEYNLNVNMMLDKFIIEFLGDGSYV